MFELTGLRDHILDEADNYDNIVKDWLKKEADLRNADRTASETDNCAALADRGLDNRANERQGAPVGFQQHDRKAGDRDCLA